MDISSNSSIERSLELGKTKLAENNVQSASELFKFALYWEPGNFEARRLLKNARTLTATRRSLPPIFVNTLPKSGSVYIWNALSYGLRLQEVHPASLRSIVASMISRFEVRLAGGGFPDAYLDNRTLEIFSSHDQGVVGQEHAAANDRNLMALNRYLDKFVVHVRDPRQALLSQLHDFRKLPSEDLYQCLVVPIDTTFWRLSFEEQIDWGIECWLPLLVDWISGWVRVLESSNYQFSIFFSRYEDLTADSRQFFTSILNFFEIDPERFLFPENRPKPGQLHYRKGSSDEWRTVFNPGQVARATAAVPATLLERFNWQQ